MKGPLNMAAVAAAHGLKRIIYLGGLGDTDNPRLSPHLRSPARSGEDIVRRAGAGHQFAGGHDSRFGQRQFRNAAIPGGTSAGDDSAAAGSKPPASPSPSPMSWDTWVGCLENNGTAGKTFDIGGPEVMTYRDLIDIYAREAGLPRRMVLRCQC